VVFRVKLLALTMTGILLVGIIPLAVTGLRRGQLREEMLKELNTLAESECAKVAKDVYLTLRAQHEKLKKEVRHDLNVAEYIMNESGGLSLSRDSVHWTATNQSSGQSTEIDLPKAILGDRWIGQNTDAAVPSPVVDKVGELVGARCTIFQRMNKAGDLLRVCTNVLKRGGARAIGTYIPATAPDGTPDPMVAAVLRGETHVGRTYVIDDWHLAACRPLFDANHKVIGAIFSGVRLEDIPELRKGIVDITVGRTGYASVMGGRGTQMGRYIISRHGHRDGENIYDSQDASGQFFVRSIIDKALQTKDGNCQFQRYPWQNPGEAAPRQKILAVTYFEPWDWVIGAGAYEDDFHAAIARVDQTASRLIFWGLIGAFMAFALCGVLAWVESGRIAAMNREITDRKSAEARQERTLQRLARLNQLQKELLRPAPLADKLKKITDCAVESFELDFCRIWHVEPGDLCSTGCIHATASDERHACPRRDACLHLLASSGRYTHIDGDHRRVPLGCYKIGRIASGDETRFLTNDVANEPRIHDREWARSLGLVSFAGYKLGDTHGNPVGVLAMSAKHAISEEDDALLSNLAEMTSGVILASNAEEAIRSSEAKYKTLYDSSGDALMHMTSDATMHAGNAAAIRLFGCKDEKEFTSLPIAALSPEYQPDGVLSSVKAREMIAIATERGSHFLEWRHRRVDGTEFPATVLLTRMELEGHTVLLAAVRDVTVQKQAELALRESERRLASIIDFLPDPTFAIDREGRVIAWNRAVEEMSGVRAEQMLGQGDYAYAVPFFGERRPLLIDLVFGDEKAIEEHYRSVAKKGACFVAESVSSWLRAGEDTHLWSVAGPLYDSDGRLVGAIESTRDVTDKKYAEESLQDSEAKYRAVYDASIDGLLLRTPDRRVVSANRAAVAMFGCKDEAELQATPPERLYPQYQPDGALSTEKAARMTEIAIENGLHVFEWKYLRRDGTTFDAMVSMATATLKDNCYVLCTVRDITARKQAEAERTLATQRMESLLALSHIADKPMDDIIATIMEDAIRMTQSSIGYLALMNEDESLQTIRYWSKSAHAMCEVIDKPIVYPLDTTGLWGEAVRQRQPIVTNDYAAPNPLKRGTPEGHVPVTRHMNIPVFDGERIVAVAGVGNKPTDYDERDLRQLQLLMEGWWRIAKQKQYEQNLAAARDEAQTANRAKSRFLATMSHEIRTPMTAILGYADLLMDPMLSPIARDSYVATIRRSGEHLLDLINDILDLSKIEAGKMTLSMQPCNLVSLLADVASVVRPRAEQRGVSFSIEYPGAIPASILTDRARLRQTIINLAGNAVKFTEKGSVRIVASFLPEGCHAGSGVQIDVVDTGIGIAKDVLPQLFRPFSQGDPSVAQKYGGTGLGLAISHQLAEMLGGTLSVASRLGRGSTFTLIVPTGDLAGVPMLEKPSEAMQEDRAKAWAAESCDLSGVRVLLAEDGFDNRELIRTILQRVGVTVDTAINGCLAVQKGCEAPFDLILMDMNMPEMDGYEATSVLRRHGYKGPIVALTANAMVGDSERCRAAGCNEYLAKPIDRRRLIQTIAALVDTKALAARAAALHKMMAGSAPRSPVSTAEAATEETIEKQPSYQDSARTAAASHEATADREPSLVSEYYDDPDVAPLIRPFVERLAGQLAAMQKASGEHEHEELRRMAHKLKGAGGSYGFRQLTDACKDLEDAARARDNSAEAAALDAVAAVIHAVERGCMQTV
jgi:PAS domain S-box-containing protein